MSSVNYWDYLNLDQLLRLQGGLEGDERELMSDELHFIIVHQAFELWFKLSLRELRLARDHLAEPHVPEEQIPYVVHHLKRVTSILELTVSQFKVMETLTPQDFLAFRDKLIPASGFQSFQMRELEILLGLPDQARINYGGTDPLEHIKILAEKSPGGKMAWQRIVDARAELSLKAALEAWLYRTPIQGSAPGDAGDDAVVQGFVEEYLSAIQRENEVKKERIRESLGQITPNIEQQFRAAEEHAKRFLYAEDAPEAERALTRRTRAGLIFIESYRELPLLAWPRILLDTIAEAEQQLVIWRSRHARMVERVIGRRIGTGGSSGVDYLDQTAQYRIFTDLWMVRTLLITKEALPPLKAAAAYGFAAR